MDHLLTKEHRCNQCHKKHSLLIEGFLEEALTLDTKNKYKKVIFKLLDIIKEVQIDILKGRNNYDAKAIEKLEVMDKILFPYSELFLKEMEKEN